MWAAIFYAILRIKKIIIGTPRLAYSNGTLIEASSSNSNTYVTVFDVTGRGEVESLIFASNQYTLRSGIVWVPRITVDGQVITPQSTDASVWNNWTTAETYAACSLPLQSFPVSSASGVSTRASCLTPIGGGLNAYKNVIAEGGEGIKFCKSCKVELYIGTSTYGGTVGAYYRVNYVQR